MRMKHMSVLSLCLVLALAALPLAAETGPPSPVPFKDTLGPNRNLAAEEYQGEVRVAANPNNADQVVAAANTWDNMGGSCGDEGLEAAFYSDDGGATWGYTCPPDAPAYGLTCTGVTSGSYPALYWNDANEVFLAYVLNCYVPGNSDYAVVVARSADGGATWSPQGTLSGGFVTTGWERDSSFAIDNHLGSPYYGRHYACWSSNNVDKSAWSSDNGATWNMVDLPTTPGSGGVFRLTGGCEMAVEDDGTVHVLYNTVTCGYSLCFREEMFHSRSTDGGASWSPAVEAYEFNLVTHSDTNYPEAQNEQGIGPLGALDVDNSGGPCDGTLYAAFGDYGSLYDVNSTDIGVVRSLTGGVTWSSGVMVNDDPGAYTVQFHPFLSVDQSNGNVIVAWHDARNDPNNRKIDIFLARSVDCGLSFETNVQVSQPSAEFNNSAISWSDLSTIDNPDANPNQFGERMGLDLVDSTAYVAWTDSRHYFPDDSAPTATQVENVGFAKVDVLPDVWSKDKPWDTGLEPDPATAGDHMWESEDIWVRNDANPGPHQNPISGQVNYVWVNVRNRSLIPAYNMPIEIWGSLASTGLSWQADWSLLGTVTVPVVPPMSVVQASVAWVPPAGGHYCLLVRHDTVQDPLTFPETSSVNYNTRFNNNIAWRNVNIIDLVTTFERTASLYFRNISGQEQPHNLVFAEGGSESFLSRGQVYAELPKALHERWVKEGSVGTGIKEVGGTTLEILDPVRSAITVTLDVGEEFSIGLRFKTKPPTVELRVVTYLFRVTQEEAPIWYPPEVNGGVTYQIQARRP